MITKQKVMELFLKGCEAPGSLERRTENVKYAQRPVWWVTCAEGKIMATPETIRMYFSDQYCIDNPLPEAKRWQPFTSSLHTEEYFTLKAAYLKDIGVSLTLRFQGGQ